HALSFRIAFSSALCRKSPYVPSTRTVRIDIDPLSVWRVVRAIIIRGERGQPLLLSARRCNAKDIEVSAALSNERQPLPIRRPSMEIARRIRRRQLRIRSVDPGYENLRALRMSLAS